jgi:endo-1,4-beta-xylanase
MDAAAGSSRSQPSAPRLRRRRFLRSLAGAAGLGCWASTGRAELQRSDESYLEAAREGIRRYRMSPIRVQVKAADGRPVTGATVEIEQLRHAFRFGANAFLWRQPDQPEREHAYRERFAAVFNSATLGFYWHTYEPIEGRPRHENPEAILNWCAQQGIAGKGHALAWANLPDPAWLPQTFARIRECSLGRVRDLVGRFAGLIDTWDVVNEPSLLGWANTRLGAWAQSVGTQAFVRQHLAAAREADPTATLLVNEVLTAYPSYSLLDELRDEAGRPCYDGVGLQSHMHFGPWALSQVAAVCDQYAALAVPLHFSEVTVLSGERRGRERWAPSRYEYEVMQGDYVPKLYTLLFGHPAVREITWWDLSDRGAWKGAAAGLLRADMSAKPAYERLVDLVRRAWWTRAQGETDRSGALILRAFHGSHRLTVRCPGKPTAIQEIQCAAADSNAVQVELCELGR